MGLFPTGHEGPLFLSRMIRPVVGGGGATCLKQTPTAGVGQRVPRQARANFYSHRCTGCTGFFLETGGARAHGQTGASQIMPGGSSHHSCSSKARAPACRAAALPMRQSRHAWRPFLVLRIPSWITLFSIVSNNAQLIDPITPHLSNFTLHLSNFKLQTSHFTTSPASRRDPLRSVSTSVRTRPCPLRPRSQSPPGWRSPGPVPGHGVRVPSTAARIPAGSGT